ncbi:MAG: flavodoxin family protein [Fusobacterium perfoetens]|uniref:flavodoxin family protein n=1 Tax=Fusobacterium perfoetens TaxID=852 RepID=UPI0023F034A1|nr:flavodoxin family protein [Fusobacterium perfoetens]MCI6153178.1 flavodoxin family protein [Fusobacterium perfoetens]MDY3237108.1 flavodoxin family protein [Fusobacterium perfoetens]
MKVLLVNGSSHRGCTFTALTEITKIFDEEKIEWEIFDIGAEPLRDCIGCKSCTKLENRCIFNDDVVNNFLEKAEKCDGFIFGSPVYYAHPSGRILSLLDRAFYAGKKVFMYKPGASILSARRGGTTASFDVLNKYFTICQMPIVSSTYWNMVHGNTPEEVLKDEEGLQTMRNLGRNMAWILKCIEAGKNNGIVPAKSETEYRTSFIR